MSPSRLVQVYITPSEAAEIAARFEKAAAEARSLIPHLEQVRGNLYPDWLGNAKDVFFSHYNPFFGDFNHFIQLLEHLASEARSIQVQVEVPQEYDGLDLNWHEESGSATLR
jgi:WXG100 family type VII secretion target